MGIDNYEAKKRFTLKNRESELFKLLLSERIDDKKLFKAGELVKQARIRLYEGKLEWAETQWQLEILQSLNTAVGKKKREILRLKSILTKQIAKLKTDIEYWDKLPVEKVIEVYLDKHKRKHPCP